VRCLNVWSGSVEEPVNKKLVKQTFVVGASASSSGIPAAEHIGDWTMAEGDGGVTEVSRQTVVMDKELERIAQEKTEIVRRMEALTIRESALEARASEIPELYAELAARRRAENPSELPAAGFATSLSPQDPVGSVWENMRDTHSTRTVRSTLPAPTTPAPKTSAPKTPPYG